LKSMVDVISNRLLPSSLGERQIANALYAMVRDLPIVSPHGHVDPRILAENIAFTNPAELLIYSDHYVTRLLHATGFGLDLITKPQSDPDSSHARNAWRIFCSNWHLYAGTSSGLWMQTTLENIFGILEEPSAANADAIYEQIQIALLEPTFRPRELYAKFGIEVLATTDDPSDDLGFHRQLSDDPSFQGKVTPTFRPDFYINPLADGWLPRIKNIADLTGESLSHQGLVNALEKRRGYFKAHGAFSVDIGVEQPFTTILTEERAQQLFELALAGRLNKSEALEYQGNMIVEMARMSCEDGLVITLHTGVFRNHSSATLERFGRDTGQDIPLQTEFTMNLRPLLEKYGLNPNLHLILFSLDETTWAREVAALAGFYPSVFIGAPWWFQDAPDAILRFRDAVTDVAGFYRGSGFIDDTRAFLSIPARHDMSRRLDCAFLAKLVQQGRITMAMAEKIAIDLVVAIPKKAFKL